MTACFASLRVLQYLAHQKVTPLNENKNLFVIDAKTCLGAKETHLIIDVFC